jgi:hypothetical protein
MPYPGSSPYPTMPPAPVRKRPSGWWFAFGGALLVAAAVVFGFSIVRFVHTVAHTDARFQDIGRHSVTLPAHVDRGLFAVEGRPRPTCSATDGSGTSIRFRRPDGRFTVNGWVAVARFDTGDGHVTFTCGDGPTVLSEVRIAAVPDGGDFVRLGLVGVVVPLLLGGAGFVVLLVTTIQWFSRRPPRMPPGISPPVPPS